MTATPKVRRRLVGNRVEFLDPDVEGFDLPLDIPIDTVRAEQLTGKSIATSIGSNTWTSACVWLVAQRVGKVTKVLAPTYSQFLGWLEGVSDIRPRFDDVPEPVDPTPPD